MLLKPYRKRGGLTVVQALLAKCGLAGIAKNCPFMFAPNHASRVASNRHYLYELGAWVAGTFSKASAKLDWTTTYQLALSSTPANQLSVDARIEPEATNLVSNPAAGSARVSVTTGQADLAGGTSAIKIREDNSANDHYVNTAALTVAANTRVVVSLFVKRSVGTRNLSIALWSGGYGAVARCFIDLGTLAAYGYALGDGVAPTDMLAVAHGDWIRLTFSCIASASEANINLRTYMCTSADDWLNYTGDDTSSVLLAHLNLCTGNIPSSTMLTAMTRQSDALRFSGLSGPASAGCAAVALRSAYPSTLPLSDVYHWGLSDGTKDNGVFLFTKASDDKLYAELRSGGAQQGTVDLGTYTANRQHWIVMDWDSTGLRAYRNGVTKTASGAVTVPASITQLEIGRGISSDTADGSQFPFVMIFNRALTSAERDGIYKLIPLFWPNIVTALGVPVTALGEFILA